MGLPQSKIGFNMATFMAWEETQVERHEFLNGEVFAMSGGTDAHYTILGNFFSLSKAALRKGPCRTFVSGMQVKIEHADAVLYPDVFVTCDPRDRAETATLAKSHPRFIAEVLSPSTGAYDRGRKFELYQSIPELQEYLLIEQDRLHADLFRKNPEGFWVLHPLGPTDVIELTSLELRLPLADLYEDVDFAPASGPNL
jgi:Uma2 family endonuclease